MPTKHMVFHKALDALDQPGCPICSLVAQSIKSSIECTFYEHVTDPDTRLALTASWGYCKEHAASLIESGNPLGVAIVYSDVLDAVARDIQSVHRIRRRSASSRAKCPACALADESAERYIGTIAQHFHDAEMHPRIIQCRGICIPHAKRLLEKLSPGDREEMRQAILSHLADLKAELSEIVRKSDYQCDEPWGEERDAWIRAIQRVSGRDITGRFT